MTIINYTLNTFNAVRSLAKLQIPAKSSATTVESSDVGTIKAIRGGVLLSGARDVPRDRHG